MHKYVRIHHANDLNNLFSKVSSVQLLVHTHEFKTPSLIYSSTSVLQKFQSLVVTFL